MSAQDLKEVFAIRELFQARAEIRLAILFGSVATGDQTSTSDVDVAVAFDRPMTLAEKIEVIGELAALLGRPVDLVDLCTAGEPLIGEILRQGVRILGSNTAYASLIRRHLLDSADFMPYRSRILRERRHAWIAK